MSVTTNEHAPQGAARKRATHCFEPVRSIGEMIAQEMASRQQANPRASKTSLFEDCIAIALGEKYPQLLNRFRLGRRFQRQEDRPMQISPETDAVDSARASAAVPVKPARWQIPD